MILLDTSAAIFLLRGQVPESPVRDETLGMSVIVEMELLVGVHHGGRRREAARVRSFVKGVRVFEFDRVAAARTAEVISALWKGGEPIGDLDSQIGGHALSLGLPLLTDNVRHFGRIEGLKVIPWFPASEGQ